MVSEIYKRPVGIGLTLQEIEMLEEAEKYPPEYDEDSPKLTPEQLAQFKPVNFETMEERAHAMGLQKDD
jgi:hypothetical protein